MFENVPFVIPMLFGVATGVLCLAPTMLVLFAGTAVALAARQFVRNRKGEEDAQTSSSAPSKPHPARRNTQPTELDADRYRYIHGPFAEFIQH